MLKYEYGFIGTGNMGGALASALNSPTRDLFKVALSNRTKEKAENLAQTLNKGSDKFVVTTNEDIAKNAHFILLGVKPQMYADVINNIKGILNNRDDSPILVSMAAGITMESVADMVGVSKISIIRIMPNTPLSIGQGVILACHNEFVSKEDMECFISHFSSAGKIHEMDESLIDAGSVVSGCGPAYAYMFIEAMAKAGENLGLSKELATLLAKETVRGAATLSEQSEKSLEELRINVCSPGGSTIEGVKSFNDSDLTGVVEKALKAAFDRTLQLGGKK